MMTKRETLKSMPDGDTLTLKLSEENWRAWYNRAWEINQEEGWTHYVVSKNVKFDYLYIKANIKPDGIQ